MHAAATKVQAAFRGRKGRREAWSKHGGRCRHSGRTLRKVDYADEEWQKVLFRQNHVYEDTHIAKEWMREWDKDEKEKEKAREQCSMDPGPRVEAVGSMGASCFCSRRRAASSTSHPSSEAVQVRGMRDR